MSAPHPPLRVQVATFNFNLQGTNQSFPSLQSWLIPTISETRNDYNASSLSSGREAPDIYAVGFQELLPLHEAFAASSTAQQVRSDAIREIKRALRPHAGLTRPDGMYPPGGGPEDYTLLGESHLVGISLFVFGRDRSGIPSRVKEVRTSTASAGVFNLLGNKGGVGVRLVLQTMLEAKENNLTAQGTQEVLTFVCAHLAAHDHNSPRRNEDFKTIVERLAFPPFAAESLPVVSDPGALPNLQTGQDTAGLQEKYDAARATQSEKQRLAKSGEEAALDKKTYGLYDSHHVFFFGDLNYRISLEGNEGKETLTKEDVTKKVAAKDHAALAVHDQLTINQKQGKVFHGMSQVPLAEATFGPTYKFKPVRGSNPAKDAAKGGATVTIKGDELSVKRIPGWPDRILWASVGAGAGKQSDLQGLNIELYRSIMSYTISDHKPLVLLASLPLMSSSNQPLLTHRAPYPLSPNWQQTRALGAILDRLVGFVWSWLVFLGAGKILLGAAEVAVLAVLGGWYISSGGGDLAYWLGGLSGRP